MTEAKNKTTVPPYASYKAFTRFLGSMRETHLPSRVDRGVLAGMSGSGQSTMLNSLESLGLIEPDGKPTKKMVSLVAAQPESAEYKTQLRALLESTYPYLFHGSIDLKTTTTNEVQGVIREQGVKGSTVAKVIAFFLSAAKDAGVEVSKYVRTPSIADVGVKKRSSATAGSAAITDDDVEAGEEIELRPGLDLDIHPALSGVLAILPAPGQPLSAKARERFLKAFEAVLLLAHPTEGEGE